MPFPLTPGAALAVAAIIETHPNPLPHWAKWSTDLRTWAELEYARQTPEGTPQPSIEE